MNFFVGAMMFFAGAGIGYLLYGLTVHMIKKRTPVFPDHRLVRGSNIRVLWALVTGTGYLGAYLLFGSSLETIESVYVFSFIAILSAVDMVIQKIPNEVLLALLAGAIVFMLLNGSYQALSDHLLGMAAGAGVFLFPFVFGKQAGGGDIKYAMVIGFSLGLYYTLLAFIVMSAFYFLFVSILLVSKKGNLKTKTALGPYMSLGFLCSLLMLYVA